MKILITGGRGMVGSAFQSIEASHDLILIGREDADLLDRHSFEKVINRYTPDAVVHLAAKVGGVKGNSDFVADFYSQNARMNVNVLDTCHNMGVKKVVSLLSTCVYPDDVKYPLTEEQIHRGEPHLSNFGYAYAKRMLDVHSRALRQQYGRNYICAVPNNLYGPHDNFDLECGHVIPAIIRKVWESKIYGKPPVFWGDGSPLREFTFSEDVASALIYLIENYNSPDPINIGVSNEISISEVVDLVCGYLRYEGDVVWDESKPSGQFRKPSSNQRFLDLGWDDELYTSFHDGLKRTCDWFLEQYPNVRGV